MEKEFVTYKIALKLKELGFDSECFGNYKGNGELSIVHSNIHYCNNLNKILAPLWSQALSFVFKKLEFYYPTLHLDLYSDDSGMWLAERDVYQESLLCEKLEIEFHDKEDMIIKAIDEITNNK